MSINLSHAHCRVWRQYLLRCFSANWVQKRHTATSWRHDGNCDVKLGLKYEMSSWIKTMNVLNLKLLDQLKNSKVRVHSIYFIWLKNWDMSACPVVWLRVVSVTCRRGPWTSCTQDPLLPSMNDQILGTRARPMRALRIMAERLFDFAPFCPICNDHIDNVWIAVLPRFKLFRQWSIKGRSIIDNAV